VTGGVSTWCDQLLRGLPEHRFQVVAVTAAQDARPRLELPDNVTALRAVPLWGWTPPAKDGDPPERDALLVRLAPLFDSLADQSCPQSIFHASLVWLLGYAQRHDLTAALRSRSVTRVLADAWSRHHGEPLSVFETVTALELLEHSLRPLSAPPIQADICHAVSNGLPSLLALTSKWTYGTPFVMSEHGVYLRERYLAFREFHASWPVKVLVLAFFRRLTELAYAEADLIAPVNVYNQRWQVEHGADPDLIVTAFNGVDVEAYRVDGSEPDVPTVVWVGRIDPLKDLVTLVDAVAVLRRQVPDVRLRLFGPTPEGNEGYERAVRRRVATQGLAAAVTFEGRVSPVASAYHSGHVVVLSSISEGLPYTIIEAMMCGRATVSTDVGGVPEVVGDAGLLVPARRPDELAEALRKVLADPELRRDLGTSGRERALEFFRVDQMLSTYRSIYAALLRSRRLPVGALAEVRDAG
jgi:glycosyltransferase involved in cell wall biosynthesis